MSGKATGRGREEKRERRRERKGATAHWMIRWSCPAESAGSPAGGRSKGEKGLGEKISCSSGSGLPRRTEVNQTKTLGQMYGREKNGHEECWYACKRFTRCCAIKE